MPWCSRPYPFYDWFTLTNHWSGHPYDQYDQLYEPFYNWVNIIVRKNSVLTCKTEKPELQQFQLIGTFISSKDFIEVFAYRIFSGSEIFFCPSSLAMEVHVTIFENIPKLVVFYVSIYFNLNFGTFYQYLLKIYLT